MRVELISVPGCPNAAVVSERLARVLASRRGVELSHRVVDDAGQAAAVGMAGSPTVLVDGVDLFAEPGRAPSLSCRLYRDEHGRPVGAPSLEQLRTAMARAAVTEGNTTAMDGTDCCQPTSEVSPVDKNQAAGRLGAPARAVHRAILTGFAAAGLPPAAAELREVAAGAGTDLDTAVADLVRVDLLVLNGHGQIAGAYPFSTIPTAHRLTLPGGATVHAMCAIDALGVSAMLGKPVTITSTEPDTGHTITVHVDSQHATWDPATAVVYAAQTGECCAPSAQRTCDYINLFTTHDAAHTWAEQHPDLTGTLLDQTTALDCATTQFGPLLGRHQTDPQAVTPDGGNP